jgi:hypothetical protein
LRPHATRLKASICWKQIAIVRIVLKQARNGRIKKTSIAGWTVVVVSRREGAPQQTFRERYNCAIESFSGAEEAVALRYSKPNVLMISTSSPLTISEVQDLGLEPGEIRKQAEWQSEKRRLSCRPGIRFNDTHCAVPQARGAHFAQRGLVENGRCNGVANRLRQRYAEFIFNARAHVRVELCKVREVFSVKCAGKIL